MAFTDPLVDHADARVALVDRRHTAGGHRLDAYPFVRLHQASAFYGVASTLLGGGRVQERGPWSPSAVTLQPIRTGFPCFGAALAGYVKATRTDDAEKNRLCPPTPFADTMAGWAAMRALGMRAAMAFGSEPDIKEWADTVALNPARVAPGHLTSPALDDALERLRTHARPAMVNFAELGGIRPGPGPGSDR